MVNSKITNFLLTALCAGDALAATSEFEEQKDIPHLYERFKHLGWPFAQIGGGAFGWSKGEYTDDGQMAYAMVSACETEFDLGKITKNWVDWLNSVPPDIGMTTKKSLMLLKQYGHEKVFKDKIYNTDNFATRSLANGSLMRNAPIVGMSTSLEDIYKYSVKQSILTHAAPLPVICCCAQSYLLYHLLNNEKINKDWHKEFRESFTHWFIQTDDECINQWYSVVEQHFPNAMAYFSSADYDPDTFSPFNGISSDGYCLLTLQIAVWAMHWSIRNVPFTAPKGFPTEIFEAAVGDKFGAIIPMIGHDCDTYAATAFPLIAAHWKNIPAEFSQDLQLNQKVTQI